MVCSTLNVLSLSLMTQKQDAFKTRGEHLNTFDLECPSHIILLVILFFLLHRLLRRISIPIKGF